jgi:hypothetical protein
MRHSSESGRILGAFALVSSLAFWLFAVAPSLAQEAPGQPAQDQQAQDQQAQPAGETGDAMAPEGMAPEGMAPEGEAMAENQGGFAAETGIGAEGGEVDFQAIEDLLIQDEAVLADPDTYSYDPGTRRDPFRSLIVTRQSLEDQPRGERPEGKAGLLIDEIVIEGVFELADGPVAQVQASDRETSYLIRPGDQLWDGDVVSIDLNEVVFKQTVNDPTALKPFREVVKRLN